jgi:hypothetical protein
MGAKFGIFIIVQILFFIFHQKFASFFKKFL